MSALSRLLPNDFVRGRVPANPALLASAGFFVVISILCAWICAHFAPARWGRHVLWFFLLGGGDGSGRDDSQLEQGVAALVLDFMAGELAGELLDWTDAGGEEGSEDGDGVI
ncbi:MAG: hypothetical protein ACXVZX_09210 [Terriglobales bacterium]